MKLHSLHIVQWAFLLPVIAWGQYDMDNSEASFYMELGIKDAQHELSLIHLNKEDELDFWVDQKAFEKLLSNKGSEAYQYYLNGKHMVYRQHQIHCGNRCVHSEEFKRQMAYYLIHGNSDSNREVVYANKTTSGSTKN